MKKKKQHGVWPNTPSLQISEMTSLAPLFNIDGPVTNDLSSSFQSVFAFYVGNSSKVTRPLLSEIERVRKLAD